MDADHSLVRMVTDYIKTLDNFATLDARDSAESTREAFSLTYKSSQFVVVLSAGSLSVTATYLSRGGVSMPGLLIASWVFLGLSMTLGILHLVLNRNWSETEATGKGRFAIWARDFRNELQQLGVDMLASNDNEETVSELSRRFKETEKDYKDRQIRLQKDSAEADTKKLRAFRWVERVMYIFFVSGLAFLIVFASVLILDP